MSRKHITYIVSHVHKSLAFEWLATRLRNEYKLTFILLNSSRSSLEDFLIQQEVDVKRILYRGKKDLIFAFVKTFFHLLSKRPDVVHAHLLDAQIIGLAAAWLLRIKKRMYTRHNSNYHHVYHSKGVRFDHLSNRLATQIISISQATDKTLLQLEGVTPSKVIKIPHGFDMKVFTDVTSERTESIRKKWKLQQHHPVVGVIARHIEWKGIQFIIPAFQQFLIKNPDATLILANAYGPYHSEIRKLLKEIPDNCVIMIEFEEDIAALYSVFDLYIHAPIDPICEAFGQTYIESLASGVPSIFTLSGIADEFIEHEKNALVVEFKSTVAIHSALERLWQDDELRMRLKENGRQVVFSRFNLDNMISSLKETYVK